MANTFIAQKRSNRTHASDSCMVFIQYAFKQYAMQKKPRKFCT